MGSLELKLKDKVAVITGGYGVIGSVMAKELSSLGVKVAILGRDQKKASELASKIEEETGVTSIGLGASVLDKKELEDALEVIHAKLGTVDFLINGAGGNAPTATCTTEIIESNNLDDLKSTFFDLELTGFDQVLDLNFKGTLLPTMIFSKDMLEKGKGGIVNISSMSAFAPLTRIPAYSAAKAAINNFTQWLSVHFAQTGVRVNAIAPGFLLTNQNRFLLIDEETGKSTPRGEKIIRNTPMDRYGKPEEIVGTLIYLLSDWSTFTTGIVVPVDGGFSAFSGV